MELKKYVPRRAMISVYGELIMEEFAEATSNSRQERSRALKQIDVINSRLNKARTAVLYERIDPADFKIMKAECEQEIVALERQMTKCRTIQKPSKA